MAHDERELVPRRLKRAQLADHLVFGERERVHPASNPVDYEQRALLYLAAREGDRQARRTLVEELNDLLWRTARRAGLDRERAAEAVQVAWLRLWHDGNQLEQPRALTKWLIGSVKHEARRMTGTVRATGPIEISRLGAYDPRDDLSREAGRQAAVRAQRRRRGCTGRLLSPAPQKHRRLIDHCRTRSICADFRHRPIVAAVRFRRCTSRNGSVCLLPPGFCRALPASRFPARSCRSCAPSCWPDCWSPSR